MRLLLRICGQIFFKARYNQLKRRYIFGPEIALQFLPDNPGRKHGIFSSIPDSERGKAKIITAGIY